MEEGNFILAAVWFFAGAVCFKFGSYIFGLQVSLNLVKDSIFNIIGLLYVIDGHYDHALEIKYENMKKTGSLEQEISEIKKIDKSIIKIWRETTINGIVNNVPKRLKPVIGFKTWDGAMRKFKEK
tara:strand:- start:478 stop:852 length:375 start_codon:yes stop_codon:yes gene_type:complete